MGDYFRCHCLEQAALVGDTTNFYPRSNPNDNNAIILLKKKRTRIPRILTNVIQDFKW